MSDVKFIDVTWQDIYERIGTMPVGKYYGIPRGGQIVAGLTGMAVNTIEEADYICDDIRDSGATAAKFEHHGKPLVFLYDKHKEVLGGWLRFPWETAQETTKDARDCVIRLLEHVGEDPRREGLLDTPRRFVSALEEFLTSEQFNFTTFENPGTDEMVTVDNIPFYSMCEHHLLPFFGVATVAYVPNKKIVGLSKIPRVVGHFSHAFQNQENITKQVAEYLQEHLDPKGVAVSLYARHLCYDHETEILTGKGWKRFSDLSDEKVAQFDTETEEISFVKPLRKIAYRYEGKMVSFRNKGVNLLVTPDHRMIGKSEWHFKDKKRPWYAIDAVDIHGRFYIPTAGKFQGKESVGRYGMSSLEFARFLGYFLSEGWSGKNRVTIVQDERNECFQEMSEFLKSLDFKAYRQQDPTKWHFSKHDKELASWLQTLGRGAKNKFVPGEILYGSLEQREAFFRAYQDGDGYFHAESSSYGFTTSSKQMASDLQQISVTMGRSARITTRKGGEYFDVRVQRSKGDFKNFKATREKDRELVDYKGMVYCVSVPTGAVVVRRRGRVSISGNCMEMRGVKSLGAGTTTTHLTGCFKKDPAARSEFLARIKRITIV